MPPADIFVADLAPVKKVINKNGYLRATLAPSITGTQTKLDSLVAARDTDTIVPQIANQWLALTKTVKDERVLATTRAVFSRTRDRKTPNETEQSTRDLQGTTRCPPDRDPNYTPGLRRQH
jgi:hypothetical protein